MFPEKIIFIGLAISLFCTIWYIWNIFKKGVRPNLVSWFIWMLAPFVGVILSLKAGAGLSIFGTFMAGFTPLLVILISLFKKNAFWKINAFDLLCGLFAVLALFIYVLTKNLNISILFAILSDGLAAIPTIIKSWKFPNTETSSVYLGGIVNNIFSLLVIKNWSFPIYSFSIYLIVINIVIIFSIYHKKMVYLKNEK
ncbi:MAG TPA: hypothetical protein PKZ36_01950 [Candidatus Paceibacterota bacterium]|nr:hypothetical protein [Candidatus Paceibacterota bacterium]HPT18150.1 hypothetical protein [Candidatus Paceibacterota bacterium]